MKKRKKLIIVIVLVILAVAVAGIKYAGTMKDKIKAVKAETVTGKSLVKSITVSGVIEPNDSQEIFLSPAQKVLQVYKNENQEVVKGDKLIKLDTTDLEYSLRKGRISLELSQKELERIQNNENSNTKVTLENAITQAEINLGSAKLKHEEMARKYERNEKLYESGFISKEELSELNMALKDLENNVENSKIVLQNSRVALEDFLDNENDIFRQTKQIEMAKTDLENLNKNIADSTVKSNISGIIVKSDAQFDKFPNQGDKIVINDLSQYKLNVKVGQYDAVHLRKNQTATIKIKGLDKEYKGKISKIAQTAVLDITNTGSETKIDVEITLDNPDENIKVGYEADADIILDERQNTTAVGFESIMTDEEGKRYIFVAEDNIVKKRYIQTGLESDFDIEIVSGIKTGETYITNPTPELKEGDVVYVNGGM
ncbi:MAG: HlyD family efflux transporter periplasmic adaptor subunit [Clostridiales bacterium]|nr:HlyD family efflux transporter periplasmic adaptor subunit [Clostridiales bacterium]